MKACTAQQERYARLLKVQSKIAVDIADTIRLTLSRSIAYAACSPHLAANPAYRLLAVLLLPLPVFGSYKLNTDSWIQCMQTHRRSNACFGETSGRDFSTEQCCSVYTK